MADRFDPRRAAATFAGDLDRHRETVARMAAGDRRLEMASWWIGEAAALMRDYAAAKPPVERLFQ